MHGKRGRDWGQVFNLATEPFFHQSTHGIMRYKIVRKWYVHKTFRQPQLGWLFGCGFVALRTSAKISVLS